MDGNWMKMFFKVLYNRVFVNKACSLYRLKLVFVCILSLTVLFNGCTTMRLPEHEGIPINQSKNSQMKDGLTVAIEPFTDEHEIKKYFSANLLNANILPVFVTAENRSTTSSFIVSKEQFSIDGSNHSSASVEFTYGTNGYIK
ncbi:MAG: hypothetical protein U0586_14705 [Candidatus Brocadiaceae bacterium]